MFDYKRAPKQISNKQLSDNWDKAFSKDSRCSYCGSAKEPIEVHGHLQCVDCGINIDPCCSGENNT